ncbi:MULTISPECIES: carbohydrate ABC transporter [Streptomyces]|uniref:carbohydrate ABC transporter n=1 Tax=Streptomyces TaxID=1883 RepID=UPI001F17870B|nr:MULTISPECIES: carbohydrate ABC transporter [unclassified Streptomyces]
MKAQNSRAYLMKQRDEYIRRYGEDLGAFHFLMMLLKTQGAKAHRRGDVQALRLLANDLLAVYERHTPQ